MKTIYLAVVVLLSISCRTAQKAAPPPPPAPPQPEYIIVPDDRGEKIVKGVINRSIIENDTAFAWFRENMKWGQADPAAVEAFNKNKDKFSMIVFAGTWCGDTKNLLPVFYRLVDKSGYPDNKIILVGVDRAKTALGDIHTQWNITNVPTFIVVQDGKEIGRVVEYGKYNQVDKELGEIVNTIQ